MTPEEYRERFGLKADYPMVAPAYAEQRRAMAKTIGLGRRRADTSGKASKPPAAPRRGRRSGKQAVTES